MTCESCWSRAGKPVCVDDDMETYMCGPCRKALAQSGFSIVVMDL